MFFMINLFIELKKLISFFPNITKVISLPSLHAEFAIVSECLIVVAFTVYWQTPILDELHFSFPFFYFSSLGKTRSAIVVSILSLS